MMRVNLIAEESRSISLNWLNILMAVVTVVVIVSIGFNYFILHKSINTLENRITYLDKQLKLYQPKQEQYFTLKKRVAKLEDKLKKTEVPPYTWGRPFKEMGFVIPYRAQMSDVQIGKDKIIFSGIAYRAEDLRELKENILKSTFFELVDLEKLVKEDQIDFQITARLAGRRH